MGHVSQSTHLWDTTDPVLHLEALWTPQSQGGGCQSAKLWATSHSFPHFEALPTAPTDGVT